MAALLEFLMQCHPFEKMFWALSQCATLVPGTGEFSSEQAYCCSHGPQKLVKRTKVPSIDKHKKNKTRWCIGWEAEAGSKEMTQQRLEWQEVTRADLGENRDTEGPGQRHWGNRKPTGLPGGARRQPTCQEPAGEADRGTNGSRQGRGFPLKAKRSSWWFQSKGQNWLTLHDCSGHVWRTDWKATREAI